MKLDVAGLRARVRSAPRLRESGRVQRAVGVLIESRGPRACIGDICEVSRSGGPPIAAEVVGFHGEDVLLMLLGEARGVEPGSVVTATGKPLEIAVGDPLLGRVLDGLGRPLDGTPLRPTGKRVVEAPPPGPLGRRPIRERLALGVRAIDGFMTCGKGQRLGIFAGSGVGKSTILAMMARQTAADVSVIALVGERGREVGEFIEKTLGAEGLRKSVVVAATSDQPALVRARCAFVATTIAEHFRDEGRDVLLVMDSVTRFAMALREVGLAAGEPPATRGYTPSVFAALPRLLERAGATPRGSITGLYTVLVEGDDMNEPIADAIRSILDGHVVLSRALASEGHFPAVDVLESVSRLMPDVTDARHREAATAIRRQLACYRESKDLVSIGAYKPGANPALDEALGNREAVLQFLRQAVDDASSPEQTAAALIRLAAKKGARP
jgi:FliI/YscN family ATPase